MADEDPIHRFGRNVPLLGPMFFGDDPAQKEHEAQFGKASAAYDAYRPAAIEARMNALKHGFSMFGPVNQALGNMYGPSAQFDFSQAFQSPMPQNMPPTVPPPAPPTPEQMAKTNSNKHSAVAGIVR